MQASLVWLGALLVAGCAGPKTAPSTSRMEKSPGVSANAGPLVTSQQAEPFEEPSGDLTLRHALSLALARNPALAAFALEDRIAEARELQAGLRPNPDLSFTLENVLGSGGLQAARQAETTLQLGQLIELGGKREARLQNASAARRRFQQEYEMKRVELLAETAEKFIHVIGDEQELQLAREAVQWAEEFLRVIRQRIQAGRSSALEEKRAVILLARNRIELEHAEHELLAARIRLASLWGARQPVFKQTRGDLAVLPNLPALEQLMARLPGAPGLRWWLTEKQLRDAELKLAETRRVSDFTAGAGLRRLEGADDHAFVFQFSMPLPIADRNQGGVAEARAKRDQAEFDEHAAETRLHSLLFGLYQELIHKQTELESLASEVLPAAREALDLARLGFEQGRYSQLELLEARKTLLEVRLEQIQAATAYHNFAVELERLLGGPLSESANTLFPLP